MKTSVHPSTERGSLADEKNWRPTILVVDNHPELCHVADLLLRRCGYDVFSATSGEEAERVTRERHVDLLLANVEMNGFQGEHATTWLRTASPETKIAFMSDQSIEHLAFTPPQFIQNPFIRLDLLLAKIREFLGLAAETPSFAGPA